MLRMSIACPITALIAFAIAAGSGLGEHTATRGSVWIGVGDTAQFAANDLLCVNEPASGAPGSGRRASRARRTLSHTAGMGLVHARSGGRTAEVRRPERTAQRGHGVLCSGRVDVRVDVEASPAFDLDQLLQGKQGRPVLRPSARTQHPGKVGS